MGNIQQIAHTAGSSGTGGWTRNYDYFADSNRLRATSVPGSLLALSLTYGYENSASNTAGAHGSMTSMPHLAAIEWDYADRMRRVDKGGGGQVFFTYDASGQRVGKVWEHGIVEERIYLGGFEIYRKRLTIGSAVDLERETLHVMDDQRRVAMVETKTREGGAALATPVTRWRFQLDNHLGSATLELDQAGNVISYEEYHPYGSTAFSARSASSEVSAKRYRYTGKERDEETGLYYHGARYYAPWLGRWTAADPAGTIDGVNVYQYALSSPIRNSDPTGHQHLEQGTPDDPVVAGSAGGVDYFNIRQSRLEQLQREAALKQQLETAGAIASNPLSALFWGIAHWISGDPNKEAAAAQLGVATFGLAASVGAAGARRDQVRSVAQAEPSRPVAAEVAKPATALKSTEPVPVEPAPPAPARPPKLSPNPVVPAAPRAAPIKPPVSSAPRATVTITVPADPEVLEAKRSAAAKALAPLKENFPDAVVGFRGSLARGAKGAHKGGVPFDPRNFDGDAFVVSDELAAKVPANAAGFRNLARLSEFAPLVSQVGRTIKQIGGVRTSDAFKIRVYSRAEFSGKVAKDERYIVR